MSDYWELRQIADAYEVYQAAEDVADQIARLYEKSSVYLQQEADRIFNRFREKYGLTEKEARRLIANLGDPADLPQLQRMLKNARQTDEIVLLRREIEAAAFRARLTRLQNLQNNIDRIMKNVYQQELKISTDFYTDIAKEAYYKGIFRLHQRANAAFSFDHVSQKVIDQVIKSRWSGENYSRRIWRNTQELARTLKEEMLVNLVTGRTIREAAIIIASKFGVGANAARRLARTESNYVHTQLNFKAYEEAGVEKYRYLATLDLRTSKICRSLDGEMFLLKDQKIGVNCPPMHPWCRSTTIAIIDEELLNTMQRSAIDPSTGKRIKVPATMKYQEWYEKYVEGHQEEIEENQKEKAQRDNNLDRQQFERYRERGVWSKTYEEFREMKYNAPEEYENLKKRYRDAKNSYVDITQEWMESVEKNDAHVVNATEFVGSDGTVYKVNDKDVKLIYDEEEYETGGLLSQALGETVEMCPTVTGDNLYVSTPDYLVKATNERWDRKGLSGSGKDAVRDNIKKKREQADNFIIDVTHWKGTMEDIDRQARRVFGAGNTKFVKTLAITKDGEIIMVLARR